MGKIAGYTKSKIVKESTVLEDNIKGQWVVGKLLGQGGFGSIYTAQESSSSTFNKVIKIEPYSNGPLYTEIKFYTRVCKEKEINTWINEKKLKFLGIPIYISSGFHNEAVVEDNMRFLVMDRYGDDLHKVMMKKDLSHKCLLQITINIVDVLEYIHSKEYSHADIKALNILQDYNSTKHVYLLDFGMVTRYIDNGKHKAEKPDPKLKNNGTLEFCPRDSHRGLSSCRRSDMESLMYNLMFWLSWNRTKGNMSKRVGYGNLPWLKLVESIGEKAASPSVLKQVAESKEKYMKNTKLFTEDVGLDEFSWSSDLVTLLNYIGQLKYSEEPKYDYIRMQLATIICKIDNKSLSSANNTNLFRDIQWETVSIIPRTSTSSATINNRKRASSDNEELKVEIPAKKKRGPVIKKVLEVNNSSCNEDIALVIPKKRIVKSINRTKKARDSCDNSIISEIIPKAAWCKVSKIPGEKVLKASSKENIISTPIQTADKVKSKRVVKLKDSNTDTILTDINQPIESIGAAIIPGMKTLIQLKSKVATRSSPRIAAAKSQQTLTNCFAQSVSCQTSPSLSVKL